MTTARTSHTSLQNLYKALSSKRLPFKKQVMRNKRGHFTGVTQYAFLEGRTIHTFEVTSHSVAYIKTVNNTVKVQVAASRN